MSHEVYLSVYNKTTIIGMNLIIVSQFIEVFRGICIDSAAR
jgi:hypothetical protein